jgi:hypothetical protein
MAGTVYPPIENHVTDTAYIGRGGRTSSSPHVTHTFHVPPAAPRIPG